MPPLRIKQQTIDLLRCPVCKGRLIHEETRFVCDKCTGIFPIINGVPILINDTNSVFRIQDFLTPGDTFFNTSQSKIRETLKKSLPSLSLSVASRKNVNHFKERLLSLNKNPRILILGCGLVPGVGIDVLLNQPEIEVVETDISWGPQTEIISDAHDIPFIDGTFDAVIAQAVLEHVISPKRCVEEIHRVLRTNGLVYAETPFMQQVHGGQYDFTRFTDLGHRILFRDFQEIERGLVCGPGMALAWSYRYFLLCFFQTQTMRKLVNIFARFTAFPLKYLDLFLKRSPGALDAASGLFFMGQKSDSSTDYRDLLNTYRGRN